MIFRQGVVLFRSGSTACRASFKIGEEEIVQGLRIESSGKKKGKGEVISVFVEPEGDITIDEIYLETVHMFNEESKIFCNGFQSWTDSREFSPEEKMPALRGPLKALGLKYYGDYFFHEYPSTPGLLHGYTYGYIKDEEGVLFVGSQSEKEGYTIITVDTAHNLVRVSRDWEGLKLDRRREAFSLYLCRGKEDYAFENYFKNFEPKGKIPPHCTGWTSWYNYYTEISEKIILENLKAFDEAGIPGDIFQIDDGYAKAVGDWLDIKKEFPLGMGHVADCIKERRYRAGIWLAPFIAEAKSKLFRTRKEWFLKDSRGRPVKAGFNPGWSYNFYALDIYNEEVQDYLENVFHTVLDDWGYDMVKLDFLYAAALSPPADKSRGEVMYDAMVLLRKWVRKKEILGCGVPLGSSFGLVDYCRIGSDVALKWEDKLLTWGHYRERVSTVNSLASTIGRHHLNGNAFLNDPDVFMLRSENCDMTENEKYMLFLLNNIFGGLLFTSDNIKNYTEDEMFRFRSMFPFREKKLHYVSEEKGSLSVDFSVDSNHYIAFANLGTEPKMMFLPRGRYFASGSHEASFTKGEMHITVEPRSAVCFLDVPKSGTVVAGTTGHLFPGSEVISCKMKNNQLTVRFDRRFCNSGDVFIRVPSGGEYRVNDRILTAAETGEGQWLVTCSYS